MLKIITKDPLQTFRDIVFIRVVFFTGFKFHSFLISKVTAVTVFLRSAFCVTQ